MLTNNEHEILMEFKQTKIPSIFKFDDTDNMLYVEHVDFDLCDLLLKNKLVNNDFVQKEIKYFSTFLSQLDVCDLDGETKKYLKLLMKVVMIFINYNL